MVFSHAEKPYGNAFVVYIFLLILSVLFNGTGILSTILVPEFGKTNKYASLFLFLASSDFLASVQRLIHFSTHIGKFESPSECLWQASLTRFFTILQIFTATLIALATERIISTRQIISPWWLVRFLVASIAFSAAVAATAFSPSHNSAHAPFSAEMTGFCSVAFSATRVGDGLFVITVLLLLLVVISCIGRGCWHIRTSQEILKRLKADFRARPKDCLQLQKVAFLLVTSTLSVTPFVVTIMYFRLFPRTHEHSGHRHGHTHTYTSRMAVDIRGNEYLCSDINRCPIVPLFL
jgi:hypothetical protein